jgi:carbonic anhydrase
MKSITKLKNLLLINVIFVLLFQNIILIKKDKSQIESLNKSFLNKKTFETAENFSEEEELEYAIPSKNTTAPAVISVEGWLKISSPEFKNKNKFPPLEVDGKIFKVMSDNRNFRINYNFDEKKKSNDLPQSNIDFYFRLVKNLIYYTESKNDVNILQSIDVISVKPKSIFLPGQESESLCFSVKDSENIEWDLCGQDKKTRDDWLCKLRTILGLDCVGIFDSTTSANLTDAIGTQIYQPIIVIPIPAKECNFNFDYRLKGKDWECGCKEGIEQSPIDIPSIENVIDSSVKPIFTFNIIKAKSAVSSIDGELKTQEYIKIKYFKNAIRIIHNNLGRIVTLDGSVYVGEEIVFHTPAEHKINGRKMDMEMQVIYYGRSKGDIAKQVVLSFLFEQRPGVYNKFLEDLDIFSLPSEDNPERDIKTDLYIPKIFYNSDEESDIHFRPFSFYTYQGSLSMPPCSEGTIHYVASQTIPIASVPIELFKEALKRKDYNEYPLKNARRTQPLNGRHVFYYDKNKYEPEVEITHKLKSHIKGHYEKYKVEKTHYLWVNNEKPSLLPGAIIVPKQEIIDNLGLREKDI